MNSMDELIEEKEKLDAGIAKLGLFINTRPYHAMSFNNQNLLKLQHIVMLQLSELLDMRIGAVGEPA